MKEKFITSKGSVEISNDFLYIKTRKFIFYETGFARILWALLPAVCLVLVISFSDTPFQMFVRVVMFSILTAERIPTLYKLIFKTSFSKRIPLDRIESVEIVDNKNGLETDVLIKLKNQRTRSISFRKLEKQYELLLDALPVPNMVTLPGRTV